MHWHSPLRQRVEVRLGSNGLNLRHLRHCWRLFRFLLLRRDGCRLRTPRDSLSKVGGAVKRLRRRGPGRRKIDTIRALKSRRKCISIL